MIFCTGVHWGSLLRIENKNKIFLQKKSKLLGFVKWVIFQKNWENEDDF